MSRNPINDKNKKTTSKIDISATRVSPFAGLRREQHLRRLEPRIMFDGAAVATIDVATDGADAGQDASAPVLTPTSESGSNPTSQDAPGDNQTDDESAAGADSADQPRIIIFIDAAVADPAEIIASADPGAEIYILDPAIDGLAQIASVLQGQSDIDAVHIISHGNSGQLILGNQSYDASDLADHASDLAIIGNALSADGDILLYGCTIADNENGIQYLDTLAALTGADIAASDDDTGHADLGGDWDLEASSGEIGAATLDAPEWNGLLAPLSISVSAPPTLDTSPIAVGSSTVWENAGFIGSTAIDLRATVVSADPGVVVLGLTIGDDPSLAIDTGGFGFGGSSAGDATVRWEIFESGTNQTVFAIGAPKFTVSDIDGSGSPNTIETIAPELNGLQSYTVDPSSALNVTTSGGVLEASGTDDDSSAPGGPLRLSAAITFNWSERSSWDITYTAERSGDGRIFAHDGDGDFVFTGGITTTLLGIDLDNNNSTATGISYNGSFSEGGAAIPIVDGDVTISQNAALGTNLGSATLTLTNAQAGDVLSITALPAGITANINTTVAGEITVTLSGNASIADYETALQAITYQNTSNDPDTSDRQIQVSVTNTTFATSSLAALSTISVANINDAPEGADNTIAANEDTPHNFTAGQFGFSDTDGDSLQSVIITTLPNAATGVLTLNGNPVTAGDEIPAAQIINMLFTPVSDISGNGLGSFTFQVKDDGGTANNGEDIDQSPNTINFNIAPVNDAPIAVDDGPIAIIGGSLTNIGPLGNDSDADGDTLTITHITDPANPGTPLAISIGNPVTLASGTTIALLANGTLDVTTSALATGNETFDYTIADGNGGTDTATVSLARSQGNLITVPASVTGTEDNNIALGITVDPALVQGGSQLDIVGTEAGFRDASAGATPTTFTIPSNATSVRITGYGGNDNGASNSNSGDEEDYQSTSIVVDLVGGTFSGQIFTVFGQSINDNDNYAFSGVALGSASDSGPTIGDTSNSRNEITVSVSGNTLSIVETQNVLDQAYLVEYLTADGSSTNFIGSLGALQNVGETLSTFNLAATADIAVLTIQDGRGGLGSTEEDKGLGRIVVDLDTGLASGTLFAQTGRSGNNTAAYSFTDYDITSGLSVLSSGATIVGDTTAGANRLPDPIITISGNDLTYQRTTDQAGIYSSLISVQSYDRLAVGSGASDLGTSETTGNYTANSNTTNTFDLSVAGGAQTGFITVALTNISGSDPDNENTQTAQVFVDLVNGTTSGSFLGMRASTPDLVSWTDVPFGTRIIDHINTVSNHAAVADFTDEISAVLTFDLITQPDGSQILSAVAQPESSLNNFGNYALTMQASWAGRLPVEISGSPAGGSFSAGSFNSVSGNWEIDPVDLPGLEYIPPEHFSGDTIALTATYNGNSQSVDVSVSRIADAPTITTLDQSGLEDTLIDISTAVTAALVDADGSETITLVELNSIPVGHTISDGVNNFTATAGNQTVDATGWNLGNLSYQATANDHGTYTIGVRAQTTDDDGFSATTDIAETSDTFDVVITSVNDAPIAVDDGPVVIIGGTPTNIDVLNGAGTDSDADGDTLTVTHIIDPTNPGTPLAISVGNPVTLASGTTIALLANGTLDVTSSGTSETETFDYTVSDGNGGTDTATVTLNRDNDGDGIADINDLDDDNDGILDVNETSRTFVTPTGGTSTATFAAGAPLSDTFDGSTGTASFANTGPSIANVTYTFSNPVDGVDAVRIWNNGGGIINDAAIASIGEIILFDASGAEITRLENVSVPNGGAGRPAELFLPNTVSGVASMEWNNVQGTGGAVPQNGSFNVWTEVELASTFLDTDGDTVVNHLDLDADNDGISDLIESGASAAIIAADTNSDGTISIAEAEAVLGVGNADADGDGLLDIFDADTGDVSVGASIGSTPLNSDNDGLANVIDLDSDNDGIPDAVEARPTAGYVSSTHVNNASNEGVNDDGLYIPVNTDGLNDGADYIDTDADEDSKLDSTESGLTPGADTNGDGIGDGVGASYGDPDGDVNAPVSDLTNFIGNAAEADYREDNANPVAQDDTIPVTEDTPVSGNVLDDNGNNADSDADGDTLSVTGITIAGDLTNYNPGDTATIAGVGTLTIASDGAFTFTPALNYFGAVPVATYTISDGKGGSDSADLTLGPVASVNDAPTADDESVITDEDTPVTINVLDGDTDVDGTIDPATVGIEDPANPGTYLTTVTEAGVGTWTVDTAPASPTFGQITFTPVAHYNGAVTPISYQVADNDGATTTAFVNVTLNSVNDAPIIDLNDDNTSANLDHAVTFTEDGGAVSVTDVDADAIDPDDDKTLLLIEINGVQDGAAEILVIAGQVIPLDTAGIFNVSVGGSSLTIVYTPGTGFINITNASGSANPMPEAGLDILLRGITFENTSQNPTTGDRTLTFTATDAVGATSAPAVSTITVVPVNDAPSANPDTFNVNEDSSVSNNVLANDVDVDSQSLTVTSATVDIDGNGTQDGLTIGGAAVQLTNAAGDPIGVFGLVSDGSFVFQPAPNYDGPVPQVTYTTDDGDGGTATTILDITITPVADAPIADDETFNIDEDSGPVAIDLLDGDTDADGDTLSVQSINGTNVTPGTPQAISVPNGTVNIDASGNVTFTPALNYHGPINFDYVVSDSTGLTDTGSVSGIVNSVNDQPVNSIALGDQSTNDGEPVSIATFGGFTDADGDSLTFSLDPSAPSWLSIHPTSGVISGTPPASASQGGPTSNGEYSVIVIVTDPGGATAQDVFNLEISNLDPVAVDDTAALGEDAPNVSGNVITDAVTGDADTAPDSDTLSVTGAVQAGNPGALTLGQPFTTSGGGELMLNADGSYDFDPNTAYNGLDDGETATEVITYTVDDGNGGTDTATLTITINGANDAPVPVDPANPGPDPSNPISADPATIIPTQNVDDGEAFTPATPLIDVSDYAVDPDAEALSFTTTSPVRAGLTLNADGTVTGTVDKDASQGGPAIDGKYEITVTAKDPDGATATITFTIDVSNPAPVAVNDTASADEDAIQSGNVLTDPLTGDADAAPDSDSLTVTALSGGTVGTPLSLTYGELTLNADGSWSFTPNLAANALPQGVNVFEQVTYTVDDGNGGTDTATLSIELSGTNDTPIVIDPANPGTSPIDPDNIIPVQAVEDAGTITPINVAPYFVDPDGEALQYSVDPADLPPGLVFDPATGVISGTPVSDASQGGPSGNGEYPVTITATDPHGAIVTTIVTFDISNPPPVAVDDLATLEQENPVTIQVLANDIDPDGDPLTVVSATAANGTVTLNPDGTITYQPNPGFHGTDTIFYVISDGNGGFDKASVAVTINAAGLNITQIEGVDQNPAHITDNPLLLGDALTNRDPFEREIIHEFIRLIVEGRLHELEVQFGLEQVNALVRAVQDLTREPVGNGSTVREMLEQWQFWRTLDALNIDQIFQNFALLQDFKGLDILAADSNGPIQIPGDRILGGHLGLAPAKIFSLALKNEQNQFESEAQQLARDLKFG